LVNLTVEINGGCQPVRWSELAKLILAFVLPNESVSYQEIQSISLGN
jgi:hypothetical protein